jgi:hypothetical protein
MNNFGLFSRARLGKFTCQSSVVLNGLWADNKRIMKSMNLGGRNGRPERKGIVICQTIEGGECAAV